MREAIEKALKEIREKRNDELFLASYKQCMEHIQNVQKQVDIEPLEDLLGVLHFEKALTLHAWSRTDIDKDIRNKHFGELFESIAYASQYNDTSDTIRILKNLLLAIVENNQFPGAELALCNYKPSMINSIMSIIRDIMCGNLDHNSHVSNKKTMRKKEKSFARKSICSSPFWPIGKKEKCEKTKLRLRLQNKIRRKVCKQPH